MSSLHTVSRSPGSQVINTCLAAASDGDGIIFIEDGVYYCADVELLTKISNTIECYGLKEDLNARGLETIDESLLEIVSYRKFVELCTKYEKVISWF